MKKVTTIVAVLLAAFAQAQVTNVNIGANHRSALVEIERQEESFYYKAQVEYNFNEEYSNVGFGFGYNGFLNRWKSIRFFAGGKIGLISHEGQWIAGNATVGAETGVSFRLSDVISVGPKFVADWREDLKFYGVNYEPSLKGSAFLTLTIQVN